MSTTPNYAGVVRVIPPTQISVANINRDGTGTIVTACAGVTLGTRVSSITVKAIVSTTAGMVRMYKSSDTGTTWRLYREIPVSAVTASASVATFSSRFDFEDLVLVGAANLIGFSTNNAEACNIHPEVMDFG